MLDPAKPTGVRPDAVTDEYVVLIKACSTLHLTHRIRPRRCEAGMSLYLCIFDGATEIAGVEVGSYADFGEFRDAVAGEAEGGVSGSRFPTLMHHPDDDGRWEVAELPRLAEELHTLGSMTTLARFVDSEDRPLALALAGLVTCAQEHGLPILFQ